MVDVCGAMKVDRTACTKPAVIFGRCLIHQDVDANKIGDRPRCQALKGNEQCRNLSVRSVHYFGDMSEYGPLTDRKEPVAVVVRLCWMHSQPNRRK